MNVSKFTESQVIEWLANGEKGMSSECMAFWLTWGMKKKKEGDHHPHDPSDFDRCLRLLHAAPGLRLRLEDMKELSHQWAALVKRWDEIEACHLKEVGLGWTKARSAPKTYALIKSAIGVE